MRRKGKNGSGKYTGRKTLIGLAALIAVCMAGCGAAEEDGLENMEAAEQEHGAPETEENTEETGILGESASDADIDFAMLQEKNPDVFAWLHVPGTGIDMPVLQSHVSDEFYITHDAAGEENSAGAVYTEMPNMMNICGLF